MTTSVRRPPSATVPARLRPEAAVVGSALASITLLGVVTLAQRGHEVPLLMAHLVALLLAAGAAYLLDDTAAEVTAVVPKTLLQRRLRAVRNGLLAASAGWSIDALVLHWRSPSVPLPALTWEVAGLVSIAVASSGVVSRFGENEPGNRVASGLGLVFLAVLVAQHLLPFTLLVTGPAGPDRGGWWAATIGLAAATFVLASGQGRRTPY